MNALKKPRPDIAHQEQICTQAEQVERNNEHHKDVVNQKEFERQTLWI
jgi:hypothetical protein